MVSLCKLSMLDALDRKLLHQLDRNSRRSNAAIARALRVGKNVVNYRIKRLIRRGIIRKFYAVIDRSKLGYFGVRVYIKFRHTTPENENEIIRAVALNKHTWFCAKADGHYSFGFSMWIRDINDFYDFWFDFDKKYRRYFADVIVSLYYEVQDFGNSFLSSENKANEPAIIGGLGKKLVKITKTDRQILAHLSKDARMPSLEMAKLIGVSPTTIKNRIDYLRNNGVILGFTTLLNRRALGLVHYKINLCLRDLSIYDKLVELAKTHPQTIYVDRTVGYADFEVEVLVESYTMFREILEEYKKSFPDDILETNYVVYDEPNKIEYFA